MGGAGQERRGDPDGRQRTGDERRAAHDGAVGEDEGRDLVGARPGVRRRSSSSRASWRIPPTTSMRNRASAAIPPPATSSRRRGAPSASAAGCVQPAERRGHAEAAALREQRGLVALQAYAQARQLPRVQPAHRQQRQPALRAIEGAQTGQALEAGRIAAQQHRRPGVCPGTNPSGAAERRAAAPVTRRCTPGAPSVWPGRMPVPSSSIGHVWPGTARGRGCRRSSTGRAGRPRPVARRDRRGGPG